MKTASFFTYAGPGRVSIARMAPRDHAAGYRVYLALAPRREMLKMRGEEYLRTVRVGGVGWVRAKGSARVYSCRLLVAVPIFSGESS